MIFVTVGTQLGFDRFIKHIDEWAARNAGVEFFAQIGDNGKYTPSHIEHTDFISPQESLDKIAECDLMVAHAGMGSVISALQHGKPIIIFPRRGELNEHRNDHQFATAKWLDTKPGVYVAWDEDKLYELLDNRANLAPAEKLDGDATGSLVQKLTDVFKEL